MSSNSRTEEKPIYFDVKNSEEVFTDLQSCILSNDTDSQSVNSNLSDLDNNERQGAIHLWSLTKNENEEITTVNLPESSDDIIDLIREDLYKFVFMPIPKQLSNYVRCRLIRDKSGLVQTFRLEVEYENDGKSLGLLTAEKEFRIIGETRYIISVIPKFTDNYYSAELQSNKAMGTSYVLSQLNGNERQQLAVIFYETNILDSKDVRKIEVLLPKFNDRMQDLVDCKKQNNRFIHLHNKSPDWNPYTCSYSLAFNGTNRVTLPSIKNFQMAIENEEHIEQIVMQFGRMSENEFSCDFRYPLSLIQTFGIALSAFESLSRLTI